MKIFDNIYDPSDETKLVFIFFSIQHKKRHDISDNWDFSRGPTQNRPPTQNVNWVLHHLLSLNILLPCPHLHQQGVTIYIMWPAFFACPLSLCF